MNGDTRIERFMTYQQKKILIWGKTHPELSRNYIETVCTGGVLEDGAPVRLYPISYRYLEGDRRFGKYQWITAEIEKDHRDTRPESFRVKAESILIGESIPTTRDEWGLRAEYIFRNPAWQFESMEDLVAAQASAGTSLGVVQPKEILGISEKVRPEEEKEAFEKKI